MFEVELDRTDGWHASWIGLGRIRESVSPPTGVPDPVTKALAPAPYLRRAFRLEHPVGSVASARLYVTALGLYEARLNGARVGDAVLAPGWTLPAAGTAVTAILAVHDRERRDHSLGALGWLDERVRLYLGCDEFLQPLRSRLRRGVALPFRTRNRASGRIGRIQPELTDSPGRQADPGRSSKSAIFDRRWPALVPGPIPG